MDTYKCEYCDGSVKTKLVDKEVFRYKNNQFVILENVNVDICDKCGARYHHPQSLKKVAAIVEGQIKPDRVEEIPVAKAS